MPKKPLTILIHPESTFPVEFRVAKDGTAGQEEQDCLYACTMSLDKNTKELRVQRKVFGGHPGPETDETEEADTE